LIWAVVIAGFDGSAVRSAKATTPFLARFIGHGVEAGVLARDDVTQLGDVLAGTASGRTADDDRTVFDSTGLAIQDLAIALAAMEKADDLDLPTLDLSSA